LTSRYYVIGLALLRTLHERGLLDVDAPGTYAMIAIAVIFPFLGSLISALIPHRDTRRTTRIILAGAATCVPFAIATSVDQLSLLFSVIVSILCFLATVYSTDLFSIN